MESCYKTFISLGNSKQYFIRLLDIVKTQFSLLPKSILVQSGHTPFKSDECKVVDFVTMDCFVRYVAEAEVLVLHAGAGSILHAVNAGKCPIVMPRLARFGEHVNDHQLEFASALHAMEKVWMMETVEELVEGIKKTNNHQIASVTQHAPGRLSVIGNLLNGLMSN